MGREYNKNGNRKEVQISFRADDTTQKAIEEYCSIVGVDKSKAIRDLIAIGLLYYVTSTMGE